MNKQQCIATLKKVWKEYVTIDVEEIEERGRRMDIFLSKFLYFHKKLNFEVCPEFSDLTSVGNILSRQFLSDIKYVHPNSQNANPGEDFAPLIHYLLEGRGWKILWIIKLVGVQTLSCNKALADLLVSLFPVYGHLPAYHFKNEETSAIPTSERVLENLEACFQSCLKHLEITPKKNKSLMKMVHREVYIKENRKYHHSKSIQDYISFMDSSDSETPENFILSRKKQLVNFRLNPVDFMYFSKPGTKSSEEMEYSEHFEEEFSDDSKGDKIEDIDVNSSLESEPMSSLEFCENVTNLLQNICEKDDSFKSNRCVPVSANILPFALEMLLSLHHGNGFVESWSVLDVCRTKQHFVRLVFTSASSLIALSNKSIEQFSLIPKLLMHIDDLVNQLSVTDKNYANFDMIKRELSLLIFNIVYGCLFLLCIIGQQSIHKRDHGFFQHTLKIVQTKQNRLSYYLTTYESVTSGQQKQFFHVHVNRLLYIMGKTLTSLKYYRSHQWHTQRCKKRLHTHCSIETHNYHCTFLDDKNKDQNALCCISSFINILSEIYSFSTEASTQMIILVTLRKIGLCCCLNIENMLQKLLTCLHRQTPYLRQFALNFIETTFLEHLGGTGNISSSVNLCELCLSKHEVITIMIENLKRILNNGSLVSPEEFNEFLNTHRTPWEALRLYRSILVESDEILVHQIEKHIIQISNFSNHIVKSELFLRVILPILYPDHYDFTSAISADHVLITCLGSLCMVLKYPPLCDIFLDNGGLQMLHHYLNASSLRPLALKILLLLITAEINRYSHSQDLQNIPSQSRKSIIEFVKSLQSVKAFQSVLFDHNSDCVSIVNVLMTISEEQLENDLLWTEIGHQLEYEADLWTICNVIISKSKAYKVYCQDESVAPVAFETLMLLLGMCSNPVLAPVLHNRTIFNGKHFRNIINSVESLLSVCISVCPFTLQNAEMQIVDLSYLIRKLDDHLVHFHLWNSYDLRLLMEMILRVATGKSASIKLKSEQSHLEIFLPECEEVDYADIELDDIYNEEVTPYETDDGYDADIELPDNVSDKKPVATSNLSQNTLFYPSLSNIVLCLLNKISKSISTSEKAEFETRTVTSIMKHLINLCKENKKNCFILYNQNIFKIILEDYAYVFSDNSDEFSELQASFMEIFVLIAEHFITSEDIKLFIKLFKFENPALIHLLTALKQLVVKPPIQPAYVLGFQLKETISYNNLISQYDVFKPSQKDVKITSHQLENNSLTDRVFHLSALLHTQHIDKDIFSSWSCSVCALPVIPSDFNLHQQFSLSLWFGLSSSSKPENSLVQSWNGIEQTSLYNLKSCVHLVSVGCDSILFEVWLIPNTSKILLRITNSSSHTHTVLCEAVVPLILKSNGWHHMTVSYDGTEEENTVISKIIIIIDGVFVSENTLKFVHAFTRADGLNVMLLGHECEDQQTHMRWYSGNLSLFKGIILTQELSLCILAMGPDCCCPFSSIINNKIYFPPLILSYLLQHNLSPKYLNKAFQTSLQSLQESLILFYTPQRPDIVSIYAASQKVDFASQKDSPVGIPLRPTGIRFLGDDQKTQTLRNPMAVGIKWLNKAECLHLHNLNFSIIQLGGVSFFMLLLSRVFECSQNENEQALIVNIFLYYCGINAENRKTFLQIEGPSLLAKLFESSKCVASYQLFKEITDACLGSSAVDLTRSNKSISLHHSKKSVITDKELITTMATSWKVWERGNPNIINVFLVIIITLTNKEHPHHEFNIQQLLLQDFPKNLLIACKEWFIHLERNLISGEMCSHLISIIKTFIEQSKYNVLADVCDFILLAHPALNTSVSYTRECFYFNLMPNPKPLAITKSSTVSLHTKQVSETLCDMPEIRGVDESIPEIDSNISLPIDTNKLTKALMNLQIKQTGERIKEHMNKETVLLELKTTPILAEEETDKESKIRNSAAVGNKIEQNSHDNLEKQHHQELAFQDIGSEGSKDLLAQADNKYLEETSSFKKTSLTNSDTTQATVVVDNFQNVQNENLLADDNLFYVKALYDSGEEDNENDENSSTNTTPEIISSAELDVSSEDWEVLTVLDSEERSLESDESSVSFLCSEMINLLTVIAQRRSDQSFFHSVGRILEMILVIANSADPFIRSAAVKLVNVYLQYAPDELRNGFLKMKGFLILGNQLHQYPATENIVQECFSILLGREFTFKEGCHSFKNLDKDPIGQASIVLILSILPNSAHDIALCHNTLCTLFQLCDNISPFLPLLVHNSLLEALIKLLENIIHSSPRITDVVDVLEQDILLNDVKIFLNKIITSAISNGKDNIQFPKLNELLILLSYIEKREDFQYGISRNQVLQIRDIKCLCLQNALNCLHDMTSQQKVLTANNHLTSRDDAISSPSLNERLRHILIKAVDFVTLPEITDNEIIMSNFERAFIRFLAQFMIQALAEIQKKQKRRLSRFLWYNVIWGIRDTIRLQLAKLLVYLLSPIQIVDQRLFVITVILKEKQPHDLLNMVIHSSSDLEQKFSVYLQELFHNPHYNLSLQEKTICCDLLQILKTCNVVVQNCPVGENLEWTKETKQKYLEELISKKSLSLKHNENLEQRILLKHENIIKEVGENAMAITNHVVEKQHSIRKLFLDVIKQKHCKNLQVYQVWQQLIQQLTHERAVWNYSESYPQSWQLDSTEGPCRERRRLQRCHLLIEEKYFLPEFQNKIKISNVGPFSFLYDEDDVICDSAIFTDHLRTKDKIRYTACCTSISPICEILGEILVGELGLYFVGEEIVADKYKVQGEKKSIVSFMWPYKDIKEVLKRRYELQENAIEIFLTSGKNSLIAFSSIKEREKMYSYIMSNNLPNLAESKDLLKLTHLWQEGSITNFEYLMLLNKFAGRTFNDLMQYPVFPFVLSDYQSYEINLRNPLIYRNFSKPMAIQQKRKEQRFIDTYNYLKSVQKEGTTQDLMPMTGPYHYGSHYSNSGIVLHFLVRLPPFTQIFLKYQDRNFDIPDRTFHSVHTSWCLSSHDSNTDIKELTPEFFFLPDFLINSEGFDFGCRQTGERVDDVILPSWSKSDPRLFILIHRQALESDFVTEHLHDWIDLIFGYKQSGRAAVEAVNVFHPATYYGFDSNTIEDPIRREAVRTMIKTFGQTPQQLFTTVHPMVSISLLGESKTSSNVPVVLSNVGSLKWGNFVGSPAAVDSTLVWCHSHQPSIKSFVSLLTNDVFGLVQNCCLLLNYAKEKGASLINITYVTSVALITWGHSDGNLRIKMRKDQLPSIFLKGSTLDPICCCASNPDSSLLFVGYFSGIVMVYKVLYELNGFDVEKTPVILFGHNSPITTIQVCHAYSIVLTATQNGDCILWDLNNLSYIQSVVTNFSSVDLAAISNVTGDFVLVKSDGGSRLQLYTINACPVGNIQTKIEICSVCFSSAPEGVSVNLIATGMIDGTIQFWSTWDLTCVSFLKVEKETHPFVCVTYSADSQHFYAANSEGLLCIWENGNKGTRKPPKYHTLL